MRNMMMEEKAIKKDFKRKAIHSPLNVTYTEMETSQNEAQYSGRPLSGKGKLKD